MNVQNLLSRILVIVGGFAMLIGALDPMEGSVVILIGSGLVMLGAFAGRFGRKVIIYQIIVFAMIAIGVGTLWGFNAIGGLGGKSGHSMWWSLLCVPYLVGWSIGIWAPALPRWMSWPGIAMGLFYVWLAGLIVFRKLAHPEASRQMFYAVAVGIGLTGLLTIAGCIYKLIKRTPTET